MDCKWQNLLFSLQPPKNTIIMKLSWRQNAAHAHARSTTRNQATQTQTYVMQYQVIIKRECQ